MHADARSAHGDNTDALIRSVSQRLPQVLTRAKTPRVLANDITCEIKVLGYPLAHIRQILPERPRNHVVRSANENGAITNAGVALDMFDHLGIVIAGQESLVFAARGHWKEADEIGEPCKRRFLQLGMLVPIMVNVPSFVSDNEVIRTSIDCILEDHEIMNEHLIHSADRLERVKIMLARFKLDVPGLPRQPGAERVNFFGVRLKQTGHRILSQPFDLQIRMQLSQFPGDRDVSAAMTQTNGRRQIERPLHFARSKASLRFGIETAIEKLVN